MLDISSKRFQHHTFEDWARKSGGLTAKQIEARDNLLENVKTPDFKDAILVDMGSMDALGDRYIYAWTVWKVVDSLRAQDNLSVLPVRAVHRSADILTSSEWFASKIFDIHKNEDYKIPKNFLEHCFRTVAARLGLEPDPAWWNETPKLFPLIGSEAFAELDLVSAVKEAENIVESQPPGTLRICIGQAGSNEAKRFSDDQVQQLIHQQKKKYPNAHIVLLRDPGAAKSAVRFEGVDEFVLVDDLTKLSTQILSSDAFRVTDTSWAWIAGGSVGRLSVLYTIAGHGWEIPGADVTFGSVADRLPDATVLGKKEYYNAHPEVEMRGIAAGDFNLYLQNLEHEEPLQKDTRSPEERLAI